MVSKIYLTGSSGFVGGALKKHYNARQKNVVALTRNLPRDGDNFAISLEAFTGMQGVLREGDVFIHLAARTHIMQEKAEDPLQAFRRANVVLTQSLAEQCVAAGVKRFVFISSIKVNGEQTDGLQSFKAEDEPDPQDAYAISKQEAEQVLLNIAANSGMEVVIIRPPLVYGPGVKGNFASLIRWVQKGIPLPLGAIHNQRSMIALDNLVDFIALCADRTKSPNAANQIFTVADSPPVSTTELLQKIALAVGVKYRLLSVPPSVLRFGAKLLRQQAAADRLLGSLVVDISKAEKLLEWKPVVTMEEQLQRMFRDSVN